MQGANTKGKTFDKCHVQNKENHSKLPNHKGSALMKNVSHIRIIRSMISFNSSPQFSLTDPFFSKLNLNVKQNKRC